MSGRPVRHRRPAGRLASVRLWRRAGWWGRAWLLATVLLTAFGAWQLWPVTGSDAGPPPALPAPELGTPMASGPSPGLDAGRPVLDRSSPTQLRIDSIHVAATVDQVGLAKDGTIEAPSFAYPTHAAWYRLGPAPGERGPSVILGHVDTRRTGAAVFYDLSRVRPGDTVRVTRQDHLVTVFAVDAIAEYPKNNFPTQLVYGATDTAQLRLITCGGVFNRASGTYVDNIVVFAHLTNVLPDPSNVTTG
jgi:hypothetical protein